VDRKLLKNLDLFLVLAVAAVLAYSAVVLASAGSSITNDPYFYLKKQLTWIGLGVVAAAAVATIDYVRTAQWTTHLYILNLLALLSVLVLGKESHGAQSWIDLGPFLFQPSEFAKVIMIVCLADFLSKRQDKLTTFWDMVPAFVYVGVPMLLILAQPDLGTMLIFVGIIFGMLFVAGGSAKVLLSLILGGLSTVAAWIWAHLNYGLWLPLEDYQLMRLIVFLDPYNDGMGGRGAGYHVIQSQVAIGSGGVWGKGLFEGSQVQLNFLPEHHTDFIFSVVGEELGLVGALLLLGCYFLLLYRIMIIASEAKDSFGALIAGGVASMLAFQLLINVGMTIGVMPITGIPLPLFSYGGSSMLANMLAMGLVISINLRRQKIVF